MSAYDYHNYYEPRSRHPPPYPPSSRRRSYSPPGSSHRSSQPRRRSTAPRSRPTPYHEKQHEDCEGSKCKAIEKEYGGFGWTEGIALAAMAGLALFNYDKAYEKHKEKSEREDREAERRREREEKRRKGGARRSSSSRRDDEDFYKEESRRGSYERRRYEEEEDDYERERDGRGSSRRGH
ncbi:uncharacterized protein J7T54_002285 [Emericellopsis cladophorae]|uniref:Uncharacterized protein n=1 Tax=Emericellopsis cladophorae TaxID=2686198 RepID=A0A9P9Y0S6_9HYPO|nr:uncharacterized protein J7T54_002285 [Emericellopsis cladophorae]KAI6781392.1 hypothetical protein J7T54_002285 [Emericellopsis cladophorae]